MRARVVSATRSPTFYASALCRLARGRAAPDRRARARSTPRERCVGVARGGLLQARSHGEDGGSTLVPGALAVPQLRLACDVHGGLENVPRWREAVDQQCRACAWGNMRRAAPEKQRESARPRASDAQWRRRPRPCPWRSPSSAQRAGHWDWENVEDGTRAWPPLRLACAGHDRGRRLRLSFLSRAPQAIDPSLDLSNHMRGIRVRSPSQVESHSGAGRLWRASSNTTYRSRLPPGYRSQPGPKHPHSLGLRRAAHGAVSHT